MLNQTWPRAPPHLLHLLCSQLVSQAHARALAEARPGVGVPVLGLLAVFVVEALRFEAQGLGELLRVTVHAVQVDVHDGALVRCGKAGSNARLKDCQVLTSQLKKGPWPLECNTTA